MITKHFYPGYIHLFICIPLTQCHVFFKFPSGISLTLTTRCKFYSLWFKTAQQLSLQSVMSVGRKYGGCCSYQNKFTLMAQGQHRCVSEVRIYWERMMQTTEGKSLQPSSLKEADWSFYCQLMFWIAIYLWTVLQQMRPSKNRGFKGKD